MLALALANPAIPPAPAMTPPPSRTILALDLGSRTGWAVLPRSGRIASGVTEFPPCRVNELQHLSAGIEKRSRHKYQRNPPTKKLNYSTKHFYNIDVLATNSSYKRTDTYQRNRCPEDTEQYHSIPHYAGDIQICSPSIKIKLAHRSARRMDDCACSSKGNAPKEDVIRAVRAQGFLPKDDNEADALALLAWAMANEIGGAQ